MSKHADLPLANTIDRPKERYQSLLQDYQQLIRELVIFGCHVHVVLSDREAAIRVMNRTRVWLAPLLALSANSPFWLGDETGYASYRTKIWSRWPIAVPPSMFESLVEYDALVQALVQTGSVEDATKIYGVAESRYDFAPLAPQF